jgi:hypothetical protein
MNVLMCADVTSIWECILSATYDCLFHEKTSRRVSSFLAMRPTLMESTLDRLEVQEQQDAEFNVKRRRCETWAPSYVGVRKARLRN